MREERRGKRDNREETTEERRGKRDEERETRNKKRGARDEGQEKREGRRETREERQGRDMSHIRVMGGKRQGEREEIKDVDNVRQWLILGLV